MKLLSTITFLLLFLCSHSQTKMLWGKVIDENFQNIAGTIIRTPDSKHQTLSDEDGNYRIEIPLNYDILIFQFVGMITQYEAIQSRCYINVVLPIDRLVELNTNELWNEYIAKVERKKNKLHKKAVKEDIFQQQSCYETPNVLYGKLFDKYQQPLVGCNILVKGQIKGTVSGKKGEFILNDVSNSDTILFSCIQSDNYIYKIQVIELNKEFSYNLGIKSIDIKMKGDFKYHYKKKEIIWIDLLIPQ